MQPSEPPAEINNWKAIAAYLGVSVRTVQTWEKGLGLPIHRMEGPDKARVWAYPSELDNWKRQRAIRFKSKAAAHQSSENVGNASGTATRFRSRWWLLIAAVVSGAIISTAILLRRGEMKDFKVQGHTLITVDRNGRELWRYAFPWELWEIDYTEQRRAQHSWLGRLNSTGDPHIVLSVMPYKETTYGNPVFCFDARGRVEWRFEPGRTVVDGTGDRMVPPYLSSHLQVFIGHRPAETRIVVSSNHYLGEADQVAFLDVKGRVMAEYWHPGHVLHLEQADLDGSGRKKLLLGGVNNGDHQATLVVLDPLKMSGVVTPKEMSDHRFELLGMPSAKEEAVVLFPRSCISVDQPYTRVSDVRVNVIGKRIIAVVAEGIAEPDAGFVYELDYDLHVVNITPNSGLFVERAHRELQRQGKLDHPLDLDKECSELKDEVVVRRSQ